jgi:hypothetical protein
LSVNEVAPSDLALGFLRRSVFLAEPPISSSVVDAKCVEADKQTGIVLNLLIERLFM